MFGWGKSSIEKAVDVVGSVADKGMGMWDASKFTAQETAGFFLKLMAATKSQATSISRRHLLWFIMSLSGSSFILAVIYNALGWTDRLDGLVSLVETWKIGYAFVAAVSFYYLTQFSGAAK